MSLHCSEKIKDLTLLKIKILNNTTTTSYFSNSFFCNIQLMLSVYIKNQTFKKLESVNNFVSYNYYLPMQLFIKVNNSIDRTIRRFFIPDARISFMLNCKKILILQRVNVKDYFSIITVTPTSRNIFFQNS